MAMAPHFKATAISVGGEFYIKHADIVEFLHRLELAYHREDAEIPAKTIEFLSSILQDLTVRDID